ncbi:MAG: D-2-hydroxyacid dehydrogenase [Actinomycetota bacterium]
MTLEKLTIGMLFPFRQNLQILDDLCNDYPVSLVWTPYMESNELRSARGLANGQNTDHLPAPIISQDTLAKWSTCDALVGLDLPSQPEKRFPKLKWFQGVGAGYDHIDSEALKKMGVIQTNARGISSIAIAEFVFARILQVWKQLRTLDKQQSTRTWTARFGTQVSGRTIGIVGLGTIGREVAIRAKAFGMEVLATRRTSLPNESDPDVDKLLPYDELAEMLPICDVVVVSAPASEETKDLFDDETFQLMKPGAIFCNISRGSLVVEESLVRALDDGSLGAAILDVTRQEPLPKESPLWISPNLYLSPHCSVSLDTYEEDAAEIVATNALRLLHDQELINIIR